MDAVAMSGQARPVRMGEVSQVTKGAWTLKQPKPAEGRVIYLDGEWVPAAAAMVSVFDHGYLYGDGVFEGIRAYNGRVWKLPEHVLRLYDSAKVINLEIPITPAEMEQVVVESVRRNGLWDAYIRLVVSRGVGDLGLDPRKCPAPTIVCIADAIKLFPQELYENGLTIITASTRRNLTEALNPRIKSLNYLNNILAKIESNEAGVMEALMLTQEGYVSEGTGDNVFIVRDGVVKTPAPYHGILAGITRDLIMQIAVSQGRQVYEGTLTRYDVYAAHECFLTGTAAEVIPVVTIDGRPIGNGKPGPVTKALIKEFRALAATQGTEIYGPEERVKREKGQSG